MTNELERHLRELGVLAVDTFEELASPEPDRMHKGYFNDPRDAITGELPF
jgi:hypothetical protein